MTALEPKVPPQASRRRERTALNREAILRAAREVFAELGYEAAGVRDIIRRTDLASGTFYNYYHSKEEVAKALAADAADRLRPILEACREQATDFEGYLRGIVRAYFRFICDEHGSCGQPKPPSGRRTRVRFETPAHRAVYEEVESSIAIVVERGLLPPLDSAYLAAAIIGVAREVGAKMLGRNPPDIEGAASFAVQLILRGIRPVCAPATTGCRG